MCNQRYHNRCGCVHSMRVRVCNQRATHLPILGLTCVADVCNQWQRHGGLWCADAEQSAADQHQASDGGVGQERRQCSGI